LRDYRRAAEWAASGDFEDRDVEESILGAFSDLDRPLPPEGRSNREVLRHLAGISPKMRKDLRAGMLAVTRNALCDLATRYLVKQWEQSAVGVLSSREMLLRANEELEGEILTVNEL
ncbi:MAG: peptidase M16, partial [Deltaproteobacteria bacterium]|nr:peptidase M16 [Deltaproteobacteria bacterium]